MWRQFVWLPALAVLIGCSSASSGALPDIGTQIPSDVRSVLEGAERLEIFALHPNPHDAEGKPTAGEDDFRGYKILGTAEVSADADRDEIIREVYDGILASEGMVAACFNPRHGIRAWVRESSVDLVICYECLSMNIYDTVGERSQALTTESPGARLTAIWKGNGVEVHSGGP